MNFLFTPVNSVVMTCMMYFACNQILIWRTGDTFYWGRGDPVTDAVITALSSFSSVLRAL